MIDYSHVLVSNANNFPKRNTWSTLTSILETVKYAKAGILNVSRTACVNGNTSVRHKL